MPALSNVTPVILTLNEAANITRCLAALEWAKRVVVVDSGSEDDTLAIASGISNVEVFTRPFDTHARQWTFATCETGIETDWVLALDADYWVPAETVRFIESLADEGVAGVAFPFRYAVHGRVLRSGIYPPVTALYRRAVARYAQDGHTQRIVVDGRVLRATCALIHDDRKPLDQWFRAQSRYAQLEARKLRAEPSSLKSWLRARTPISPLLIGLHCLFVRGGIFEGAAGWVYALQRMVAEGAIVATYHDQSLR
jgi:hypothetical protein